MNLEYKKQSDKMHSIARYMTARLPDIQAKRKLYSDVVGEPLAEPPGVPEVGQGDAALLILHPLPGGCSW